MSGRGDWKQWNKGKRRAGPKDVPLYHRRRSVILTASERERREARKLPKLGPPRPRPAKPTQPIVTVFPPAPFIGDKVEACLWFDGACNPNPGYASGGIVLRLPRARTVEKSLHFGHGTCNSAEYMALIAGLEAAAAEGVTHLEVYGDSKLVINAMLGAWRVHSHSLRPLYEQAQAVERRIAHVEYIWTDREQNAEADALSKAATCGRTLR